MENFLVQITFTLTNRTCELLILMQTNSPNDFLYETSRKIRLDILNVAGTSGGGHLGGTFSCVDILVNLYLNSKTGFKILDEGDGLQDRFILSKGHACLALYAILAFKNIISSSTFFSFGKNGGIGAQLDINIPSVVWNTGSLGHSIGICAGMGQAFKSDNSPNKCITLIGDSELSEGANWEAIAYCKDKGIDNVIVIIDRNRLSVTERIDNDAIYSGLDEKMKSYGWEFIEIDGHSHEEISKSLVTAKLIKKPIMILANTVKGKGVKFMENNAIWHHKRPTLEQLQLARIQLNS